MQSKGIYEIANQILIRKQNYRKVAANAERLSDSRPPCMPTDTLRLKPTDYCQHEVYYRFQGKGIYKCPVISHVDKEYFHSVSVLSWD